MTVSVIIITYNQQHCIDRAIAGVMHQRGDFDIELIVANDASTDDTLTHVKRWQRRYPQSVKIIDHPANVGFRANYLSAFRAATGRYLAMCDADDYWTDPGKLARQTAWMEAHPECAITFHRVINVYEPGGEKSLSNGGQAIDTDITHLSRSNYITNMSVMYRRALVTDYPDWLAEASLPDYAYHMLYAAHGSIHYFSRPMGVYSQSAAGAWSLNGEAERLKMALDVRKRLIDHLPPDSPAQRGLRDASADIVVALADLARRAGDRDKARMLRDRITEIAPHLDDAEIDRRLQRRADLVDRRPRMTPKRLARRAFRLFTRLLPSPRPC